MTLRLALIVAIAFGLAAVTYLRLERAASRVWVPLVCRGLAWAALGVLALNVSCPVTGAPGRPLVLLDASLSMTAAGGRWAAARDSAARWGEVRRFGDHASAADTGATLGRSLLAPALTAALASGRPVVVVSDGEVEDAAEIPADLLAGADIRLFPRTPTPDLAVVGVAGPTRVAASDTVVLDVDLRAAPGVAADSARVEVRGGTGRLAVRAVRLRSGVGRLRVRVPAARLRPGDQVLEVALGGTRDAEPRTDRRLHLVTVVPTPGIVLVAEPGDWDARFLFHTLRDVAELPTRGYVRLARDRWRSMTDLSAVSADEVRRAARAADLVILRGASELARPGRARGVWSWPVGAAGAGVGGDWYLSAEGTSPVAGAFLGQPVDSFPPATELLPATPAAGDWIALTARLGRRGGPQPAVFGREQGGVRRVFTQASGLWRWAFRGGSAEQSYRAWVAATVSWLLGGATRGQEVARPVRAVVQNGQPVLFEWTGAGPPRPTTVTFSGPPGGPRPTADTLAFDPGGRAAVRLPPGEYRYEVMGGGRGTVAVEAYSDELLPRPVALAPERAKAAPAHRSAVARDQLWLFALCAAALAAEWLARRRIGLR